ICQRRSECLREGVFGGGHIPCPCREKGDELAVAATRHRVCRAARLRVAFGEGHAFTLPRSSRRHGPGCTDLDDAVTCARATRCARDPRVQIGPAASTPATDWLFRLHLRPIPHL